MVIAIYNIMIELVRAQVALESGSFEVPSRLLVAVLAHSAPTRERLLFPLEPTKPESEPDGKIVPLGDYSVFRTYALWR